MSDVHIRFASDILRRLGEELNPSVDQGILELVKNAYDADARNCHVELRDTLSSGGTIRVTDDGGGMTRDDIVDGWLVLGRSSKDPSRKTPLGRYPAGSKGLGRLAALRMGDTARLDTRPAVEGNTQHSLEITWSKFDNVSTVDEVPLRLTTATIPNSTHGTEIFLDGLRSRVGRTEVKRLARSLILLADPFADDPQGFNPTLEAPGYADLERLVTTRYFDDAEYHLVASLDGNGLASAQVLDFKGDVLFSAEHSEIAGGKEKQAYRAPRCDLDLWAFILSQLSFQVQMRKNTLTEIREWLKAFGGVHIYHNGIRVAPYGNQDDDWLGLNLSRVKSPEERPSTNTAIGRVAIHGGESDLIQKTDRSGFIETEAFQEIREFARDCMEWMARRRMEQADRRRAEARAEASKQVGKGRANVDAAIEAVPDTARAVVRKAFEEYDKSREKESSELRKEVQLYRTLSTAGITAATFAHESSGNPLKVIAQAIRVVERRGGRELGSNYGEVLSEPVGAISRAVDALSVLSSATLSLINHDKRRLGRVNIHQTVLNVVQLFRPFLDVRAVRVDTQFAQGAPYFRASEAAIESIITNLLNNSISALENAMVDQRQIGIITEVSGATLTLSVLDNGPGIEGIGLKDIWLPGETTRPNGTGLGLTIVRDTVVDLGGTVSAIEHSALGGAQVSVELPILGL